MTNIKVRFVAALADSSGYSEASRNYLCALDTLKEIDLCATSLKFEMWKTEIGKYGELVDKYTAKSFEPDLQIIHLTPDCYPKHINKNIKNCGYAAWETSRLPEKWVGYINQLSEIWVPSAWNVEVFKSSGVSIPVVAIPHAIDVDSLLFKAEGPKIDLNIPPGKFSFYSIFQWTERKNPTGLLKAFFSEFRGKENVVLVLKSYLKSHAAIERDKIREEIQKVRKSMFIDDGGPVVYIGGDLSSEQVAQLHKQCDCLVAPTRAEGFGLTVFEGMAFGKPTITTGFGGVLDFANENNSYLIRHGMTQVSGMPWELYNGRALWAEPDGADLARQMRYVFEHQDEAKAKGAQAAKDVRGFGWEAVGKMMMERIKVVMGGSK